MKILLTAVNAKYIHSNPAVYSLQKFTAEYAPEYKNDIELAEFTINHYEMIFCRRSTAGSLM